MDDQKLYKNEIYHLFNRSIAGFKIFKNDKDIRRFLQALAYYATEEGKYSLSVFLKKNKNFNYNLLLLPQNTIVKFIAYCIMPDHYHLVVKVKDPLRFSKYINDVENSYTRYFNTKTGRRGPLWESRFKRVRVETDEQLLHLTRYVHLNPTSDGLVRKPEEWRFSSYKDYINSPKILREVLYEITITSPKLYKEFVDSRKDYQRKLKEIRRLLFRETV